MRERFYSTAPNSEPARTHKPVPPKATRLTQKIAGEYVTMLGGKLKRNAEYDEYRVRFGSDVNDYFAADLVDAIQTARCMAGGHENLPDAERYLVDCGIMLEVSL